MTIQRWQLELLRDRLRAQARVEEIKRQNESRRLVGLATALSEIKILTAEKCKALNHGRDSGSYESHVYFASQRGCCINCLEQLVAGLREIELEAWGRYPVYHSVFPNEKEKK